MIYFTKSERIGTLERTSTKGTHPRKERGTFMKKTTLKKIIRAVRDLTASPLKWGCVPNIIRI